MNLYDADTAELIGRATASQVTTSKAEIARGNYSGVFTIDSDGDTCPVGSWGYAQLSTQRVYVQ